MLPREPNPLPPLTDFTVTLTHCTITVWDWLDENDHIAYEILDRWHIVRVHTRAPRERLVTLTRGQLIDGWRIVWDD